MTDCVNINSVKIKTHREWRKLAKKMRRKRIRQSLAIAREKEREEREKSPRFLTKLAKEKLLEEYEMEKEEFDRKKRHEKWLKDEEEAQIKWKQEQRLRELAEEAQLLEQERIRMEFEKQQKKKKEEKELQERLIKEENERRLELVRRIDDYMNNGGDIPAELDVVRENNPGRELCPFFSKVGACRFGYNCSRNHRHPGLSCIILIKNFYTHFTMNQQGSSEYDTDILLEYDDKDMYSHFKDFYQDIVPELKKQGRVKMIKVCCNYELHLRGNVYVEYSTKQEALLAYRAFQGRWYGGKQLNVDFTHIPDWKAAICGDFLKKRCPKGNSCNFLHVYINPNREYTVVKHGTNWSLKENTESKEPPHKRHWRWSESPQKEVSDKKSSRNEKRKRSPDRHDRRQRSRNSRRTPPRGDRSERHSRRRRSRSKENRSRRNHRHT